MLLLLLLQTGKLLTWMLPQRLDLPRPGLLDHLLRGPIPTSHSQLRPPPLPPGIPRIDPASVSLAPNSRRAQPARASRRLLPRGLCEKASSRPWFHVPSARGWRERATPRPRDSRPSSWMNLRFAHPCQSAGSFRCRRGGSGKRCKRALFMSGFNLCRWTLNYPVDPPRLFSHFISTRCRVSSPVHCGALQILIGLTCRTHTSRVPEFEIRLPSSRRWVAVPWLPHDRITVFQQLFLHTFSSPPREVIVCTPGK